MMKQISSTYIHYPILVWVKSIEHHVINHLFDKAEAKVSQCTRFFFILERSKQDMLDRGSEIIDIFNKIHTDIRTYLVVENL